MSGSEAEVDLIDHPLEFRPPPLRMVERVVAPLRKYFDPRFFGLNNVDPRRPTLFVANHTLYAVMDPALYIAELYRVHNIFLRSLGDFLHFEIPGYRKLAARMGIVRGDRATCARLMRAGEHLLVYPGGSREAAKRKGEEHRLHWSDHTGFAKLAIEHGYQVIPIASVGPDYAFSILLDGDQVLNSPVGSLLRWTGLSQRFLRNGEMLYPVVRGIGPTPLPRPERFFIKFGTPIDSARFHRKATRENVLAFRGQVEEQLDDLIDEMLVRREEDNASGPLRRLLTSI